MISFSFPAGLAGVLDVMTWEPGLSVACDSSNSKWESSSTQHRALWARAVDTKYPKHGDGPLSQLLASVHFFKIDFPTCDTSLGGPGNFWVEEIDCLGQVPKMTSAWAEAK